MSNLPPSINLFFGGANESDNYDTHQNPQIFPLSIKSACINPNPISGRVEIMAHGLTPGMNPAQGGHWGIGSFPVTSEPGSPGFGIEGGDARPEAKGARRSGEGALPCEKAPLMQCATRDSPDANSGKESAVNLYQGWRWEDRLRSQVTSPLQRVRSMQFAPRLCYSPATNKGKLDGMVLSGEYCGVVQTNGLCQKSTKPPPLKTSLHSGEASGMVENKLNAAIIFEPDIDVIQNSKDVAKDIALVGEQQDLKTLEDFDFAPQVAPTSSQLFPHTQTHTVLIAARGEEVLIDPKFDWIVDSGCTSHMSNNPSLFTNLRPHNTTITTAGTATPVTGIGTARLRAQLSNEITNFTLTNTLLVCWNDWTF